MDQNKKMLLRKIVLVVATLCLICISILWMLDWQMLDINESVTDLVMGIALLCIGILHWLDGHRVMSIIYFALVVLRLL